MRLLRTIAAVVAVAGCRQPARTPPRMHRPSPPTVVDPDALLGRARALTDAMVHGNLPAGVDRTVQELADLAARFAIGPQHVQALRAAGDLLASRAHVAGRPDDLARAESFYRAAGADSSVPGACEALQALAELFADDPIRRAGVHDAYEMACVPAAARTPLGAIEPTAQSPVDVPPPPPPEHTEVHRVVLDPGHGGSDPGAIGPTGLHESVVNLDVARRVADSLALRHGVQVVLTRDRDVYIPLEDRAAQANAARADLFVSIHCNSAPNTEARGISTYILDTQSDRVAARVTAREGELVVDDPIASPDLPRILADFRLAHQGSRSVALAMDLQSAMLHDARLFYPDAVDAGVHPAAFHVLVSARMPAVLVELSFISNLTEERRLRSNAYRDVLASAIARGIAEFTPSPHLP